MAYANDHYKCTPLDQISKDGHRCRQVATPRAFIEIMHEKRRRDWALKQQKICFPAEDHLLNVTFFQRLESNVKRSQILRVGDMVFYNHIFLRKRCFSKTKCLFLPKRYFFYERDVFHLTDTLSLFFKGDVFSTKEMFFI